MTATLPKRPISVNRRFESLGAVGESVAVVGNDRLDVWTCVEFSYLLWVKMKEVI